jgi:hypothetical protein
MLANRPLAVLWKPPLMLAVIPLARLRSPPLTLARSPLAVGDRVDAQGRWKRPVVLPILACDSSSACMPQLINS